MEITEEKIIIEDQEFYINDLDDKAQALIESIQVVEEEILSLNKILAITQTARNAYGVSLTPELPAKEAPSDKENNVFTINNKRYSYEDMSEKAYNIAISLSKTNERLEEVNLHLSISKTAKSVYINSLQEVLQEK